VIGSSDEIGGYPRDRPIPPPDVAATIYRALGVDLETPLMATGNRPVPVVDYGHPAIKELF
jgi:hypothetical protein